MRSPAVLALVLALLPWGVPAAAQVEWDSRGDLVLSSQEALLALEALPADSPAPVSWGEGGSRTGWFGESWEDVDGDGCDTRNEILARDLTDPDFSRSPGTQGRGEGVGQGAAVCPDATVWSGTLHDPYTGTTVAFQRGQDTSAAVQVDHVIPLSYLYAHGAWQWDARTRLLAANDPLNLLAVDGQANQSKSGCGPATCPMGSTETGTWQTAAGSGWWPKDSYRCQYADRFVSVASVYSLGLPEADSRALRETLTDCAAGGDGAPSVLERTTTTVRGLTDEPGPALLAAVGLALLGTGVLLKARRALRRTAQRSRRGRGR
ncbi:MAG: HNH endonuclease family protein [Actinomyces sp.]|uniref:HNH endonuclease family protein n=1 Tax=Actinomyces sp. TaxID=29317 RepID=UPI0026DC18EC|nr:HNH endonuclease family protein [Actinomyces sp.]MDO4243332.1 HNH endonuclease family protein [Actinomyces sp.]